MSKLYKPFSYMSYFVAGAFIAAAFYAYPYVYLPLAGGLGYLGYFLGKRS